ncbi:Uncharacterized protein OS=Sorangium cellulosum (strain So ce56) GN=sce5710 PE=4 SV=1 [Gemmata massiliana]|uniref:Uncharacterized protein n=1 Tax=Gemmata massiliana TaxID=1210884 RepID=A0A6P2CYJ9_9BACT|nr:hypothetical protein [Gemmata massiliana]VTR93953.1 Uncharacterized protein OS=Sorangium cellulosum (strain So ce56) GN=sce5710 PE=4 SV=1 [Gemmata massiliana]
MTDREWDDCPHSDHMLMPLHGWMQEAPSRHRALDRKLRLFAVACCRQRQELFTDPYCARAIEVADGQSSSAETKELYDTIMSLPCDDAQAHAIHNVALKLIGAGGLQAAMGAIMDLAVATGWDDFRSITAAQAPLLRCVVGNPFRPVALDPRWRTTTAVDLGEAIYADRAFERLPILADALQDAGCSHPDVLGHCRSPGGAHSRGCWVIDLLLEKT